MSADVLAQLAPAHAPQRPARTLQPLERPLPQRRPRLLYGVIAVAGAVAIGAAQMGLSILTTQTSYEIADLTSQQRVLSWQKQMLQDEVAGLSSPQYLAANAAALGLVTGQPPTYLRLSDAAIFGTGAAAGDASAVHALTQAAVSNALVSDVPLVTDPAAQLNTGATVDQTLLVNTPTPPPISDGLPTPATH